MDETGTTGDQLIARLRARIAELEGKVGSGQPSPNANEQQQAEEALRESRERLSLALRSAGMGAWRLDLSKNRREFDEQVCRCLGIDPSQFAGTAEEFYAAVHPDDRNRLGTALARTIATGEPYEVEYRAIWSDGSVHHIAARGQLARDAAGNPLRVEGLIWDVTARRQIEAALQEREEQLRLFVEHAPAAIAMLDGQMRYVAASRRWFSDYGLEGRDLRGRSHYEVFPEISQRWKEIHRRCLAGAVERAEEDLFQRNDGTVQWLRWEVRPWHLPTGAVGGIVIFSEDITQRKLADQALRKLNRTLRALSNSIHATVRASDERKYVQDVCQIIVKDCGHRMAWVGYAREDEGRTVEPVAWAGVEEGCLQTTRISWADTERGRGPSGISIRTGQVYICNNFSTDPRFKPWREEAIKRSYASSISLPLMAEGTAFGALMIYSDQPAPFSEDEVPLLKELADNLAHGITSIRLRQAHAEAAEALRQSEEKFARAFANNPAAIALTRLDDGTFLDVNDTWVELNGYSRQEVIGRPVKALSIWPTAHARVRFAKELREKGSLRGWEQEFLKKSGERFVAQISAQVLNVQGEEVILSTLVDITDRKRAEEALTAAKISAEQAKGIAESASRAKDQFIAVLSHELRTPLTPAVAAMSLLRTDMRLPSDVREDLEMVSRNLDLEVRLIADLLDVSRIISGKLHLEKRPTDVADAIREAAKIVAGDLDAMGHTLAVQTPDAPYLTLADTARLQQVFWNLLRNSIKFSPARSPITVRAKVLHVERCPLAAQPCPLGRGDCPQAGSSNGHARAGNLVIDVIDKGSGIAAEMLPRLFNAFEQEDKARTFGGLGLGLSICKAVVEMHGGAIAAHSEGVGCGATFTVRLPIAQCSLSGDSNQPSNDPGLKNGQEPRDVSRPLRVLLVEDHPDTAKLLRRLLMAQGHEVTTADSIAEALAAFGKQKPDLLISDLGLPDGSGLDLMRQLSAQGQRIPAIALSGYGTPADIAKSKAAGFTEHLVKPLHSMELLGAAIARLGVCTSGN